MQKSSMHPSFYTRFYLLHDTLQQQRGGLNQGKMTPVEDTKISILISGAGK